jgi:hypothetical protein
VPRIPNACVAKSKATAVGRTFATAVPRIPKELRWFSASSLQGLLSTLPQFGYPPAIAALHHGYPFVI